MEVIEDILDDLRNSLSQPEADSLFHYMKRKKYHMVKKLLAECISEDKIESIIKYYKEKFHEKKSLIEVNKSEFQNIVEEDSIIVSYGGNMFKARIMIRDNVKCFLDTVSYDYVPLKNAVQIWKINNLED